MDYRKVFDNLYRKLCLYATHYVTDIDAAEDIVMDVLTTTYEHECGGEQIQNPEVYLFRAVRNRCLHKLRDNKSVLLDFNIPDIEDDKVDAMEELSREDRLWTAIGQLPQRCRQIFLMSKRDGMKYQQIADQLNISVKTVEAQIGRAYAALRRKAKEIYLFLLSL